MILPHECFVFGSNLSGRHGKGAALIAVREYGAIYGQAEGLQGRSYAIPTKDKMLRSLSLIEIEKYVSRFIKFAIDRQDIDFYITPVGCGLAGHKREDIRPMFDNMPTNCRFAETW